MQVGASCKEVDAGAEIDSAGDDGVHFGRRRLDHRIGSDEQLRLTGERQCEDRQTLQNAARAPPVHLNKAEQTRSLATRAKRS